MLKTWMAPAAAVLAVLLLVGSVGTAEADRSSGGWNGGGKFAGGKDVATEGPQILRRAKVYAGPKFYGGNKFYGGPKIYGGKSITGTSSAATTGTGS